MVNEFLLGGGPGGEGEAGVDSGSYPAAVAGCWLMPVAERPGPRGTPRARAAAAGRRPIAYQPGSSGYTVYLRSAGRHPPRAVSTATAYCTCVMDFVLVTHTHVLVGLITHRRFW